MLSTLFNTKLVKGNIHKILKKNFNTSSSTAATLQLKIVHVLFKVYDLNFI